MKKVYVSTYCHWTSFGSMLQSVGLQRALKKLDLDVKTIVYSDEKSVPAIAKVPIRPNMRTVKSFLKHLNKNELEKGRKRCLQFMNDNIQQICISDRKKLHSELPIADVYIAGSDQIWHPALCREDFFLSHVPEGKRRISYAASMGVLSIPEHNEEKFRKLLQNFDSISVREEEMVLKIQKYTDKPVLQHIDPTFLVSPDEWRQYENTYDIQGPYILVYAIYWDKTLNKQVKELHKKTGYRVVSIQNSIRPIHSNLVVMDAGPAEFLWLIDHAEAVITSSFHGIAFSVIFNKRFYPVVNPNAPSRIDNLLKTLSVHTPTSLDKLMDYIPDYSEVNICIDKEKNRSIDYLRKEVNDEE